MMTDSTELQTITPDNGIANLAGRVLSSKSMQYAKAAFEALRELLASAEKEKETPDEDTPMDMTANFAVFELAGLTPGKPFAGFAVGEFVDMYGRAVKFTQDKLSDYLKNTLQAIKSFQAKGRPGLPIDSKNHDKGEAAGWITGAELGQVIDSNGKTVPAIMLLADWTELGVRQLAGKIMAGFSPTVDQTKQRIVGGSLTNWDASVDSNGVPLFNAIELSNRADLAAESQPAFLSGEGMMTLQMTQEEFDKQVSELADARVEAALTEAVTTAHANGGAAANRLTELVEARVNARWQEKIELMQRESAAAELAREVTEKGIPYSANTLTAELTKLNPAQADFWGGVLKTIVNNGLTNFAELGHGGRITGAIKLPESLTRDLDAGELSLTDLANPILGLGDLGQYDLSRWKGEK